MNREQILAFIIEGCGDGAAETILPAVEALPEGDWEDDMDHSVEDGVTWGCLSAPPPANLDGRNPAIVQNGKLWIWVDCGIVAGYFRFRRKAAP